MLGRAWQTLLLRPGQGHPKPWGGLAGDSGVPPFCGDAVGSCCQNHTGLDLPSVPSRTQTRTRGAPAPAAEPAKGSGCLSWAAVRAQGRAESFSALVSKTQAGCLLLSTSLFMARQPVPKEMSAQGCHFSGDGGRSRRWRLWFEGMLFWRPLGLQDPPGRDGAASRQDWVPGSWG